MSESEAHQERVKSFHNYFEHYYVHRFGHVVPYDSDNCKDSFLAFLKSQGATYKDFATLRGFRHDRTLEPITDELDRLGIAYHLRCEKGEVRDKEKYLADVDNRYAHGDNLYFLMVDLRQPDLEAKIDLMDFYCETNTHFINDNSYRVKKLARLANAFDIIHSDVPDSAPRIYRTHGQVEVLRNDLAIYGDSRGSISYDITKVDSEVESITSQSYTRGNLTTHEELRTRYVDRDQGAVVQIQKHHNGKPNQFLLVQLGGTLTNGNMEAAVATFTQRMQDIGLEVTRFDPNVSDGRMLIDASQPGIERALAFLNLYQSCGLKISHNDEEHQDVLKNHERLLANAIQDTGTHLVDVAKGRNDLQSYSQSMLPM